MTDLPDDFLAIDIPVPGGPEVLAPRRFPMPAPRAGEVLIEVAGAGVNRADIRQRLGTYHMPKDAPSVPGLEVSGRVVRIGEGVERWRPGDEVCALVVGGGYAEYCVAPAAQCLPLPAGLGVVEAAALPEAVFTVWTSLIEQAQLLPGETLLVHGGASGIGTTAIQIATAFGVRVAVTAGDEEKCAACRKLGAERAINYRAADFAPAVMEWTGGRGVDVILDMVGAPYIARNIDCLAPDGRLAYIAYLQGRTAEFDIQKLQLKRLRITGSTLRHRSIAEKGRIAALVERRLWPLIEAGRFRPVVSRTLPLAEAATAHRALESGRNIGKIVLWAKAEAGAGG